MNCTKSNRDEDIKPQGIFSKIVAPDSHETRTSDTNVEFSNPAETFSLETEHADSHAAEIHPDGVGKDGNLKQELAIEEEDAEKSLSTEALDDLEPVAWETKF